MIVVRPRSLKSGENKPHDDFLFSLGQFLCENNDSRPVYAMNNGESLK